MCFKKFAMSFSKQIAVLILKIFFSTNSFALLVLLMLKVSPALSQQVIFNKVVPFGGFPGFVGGITQDKNGYLWIATRGGLYRYDGYKFKLFTHDPNRNSLSADNLETVYADREGMIWICTWGKGLDRLDPVTGIFTPFSHDPGDPESLSSDSVRAVLEDRDGILWVGTDEGLSKYNPKTGKFKNYHYDPYDLFSLSCNSVRILYEDRKGTIWVGTGDVWDIEAPNAGGLNRFDKRTGKFIRYLHNPHDAHSLINNKVRAIYEDSRGVFWVGTAGDGLHTMDRKTGTFERHEYDPKHPERLSRPSINKSYQYDHISFITEDTLGNIWIGTLGNGLNLYDPKTQKLVHYGAKSEGITNDHVWSFCNSKDGTLWIGTDNKGVLYRIDPYHRKIPHVYTGSPAFAFNKDSSNNLWVGTGRGLILRNTNTGASKRFVHQAFNQASLSNDTVWSMCRDHEGILWVGTSDGLNRFNVESGTFTRYQHNLKDPGTIRGGDINAIDDGGGDSLWIGIENGLDLMNKHNGSFTHFKYNPKDTGSLGRAPILSVIIDKSGNLWLGTLAGLDCFNLKKGELSHFLKGILVLTLFQDSYGTIWAGGEGGLYKTSNSAKRFIKFADPTTDAEASNGIGTTSIYSIWEDNQKNIWVSTSNGIYKIDPLSSQSTFFGTDYGVGNFSDLNYGNGWKGPQDEIYLGDENGYYILSPNQLRSNPTPPWVIFLDFRIDGKSVVPGEGPLASPLDSAKKITLKHNQNSFSFDLVCIHYSNPNHNRSFYKLENYDRDWRNAGAPGTAYYYNVPPGNYVFKIKTASADGVWAERSIEVTIMPPWWSTWWAYFMYAVLIAAVIWTIVYYHSRSLRRELEQRKKEQQFAEMKQKTAELERQATEVEMQALRAQMNPHFIFNSLNSIDLFILQNDKAKASKYLTKFSRLIRMILNSSANATVSLAEDLEALQLYLELENLRLENKFSYKIECDPNIDTDYIQVPPMLMQPFAENAIWHGLVNKKDEGHLCINISQEDSVLICTITDDGIGRKKAAELEDKSGKHKSMGMKITEGRIAMMQEINGENESVKIRDLVDAEGNAAGTEVVLKIPVIQS
jgi:ligand-binding sensor domain-containing protein